MGGPGPIPQPRQQTGSLGGGYAGEVQQKAQMEEHIYIMLCQVPPDTHPLPCRMTPSAHSIVAGY